MIKSQNYQINWDKSFRKNQNFLIYPNEQIIKFVNKFIKKRDKLNISESHLKCLDIGCGSGRHVVYLSQSGFKVYGIDFSNVAIKKTKLLLKYFKIKKKINLYKCSSTATNFKENYFDFLVSHGTFDSMPYLDCKKSIAESFRILKKGGLFYVDLISRNVKNKGKYLNKYDQLVSSKHEQNTIQSYFDFQRIQNDFKKFKILQIYKILIKQDKKLIDERFHCVLLKK